MTATDRALLASWNTRHDDDRCPCGDSGCDDSFGRATKGQDRTACCQYCGFFDCDVCGWTDPSGATFTDYLLRNRTLEVHP